MNRLELDYILIYGHSIAMVIFGRPRESGRIHMNTFSNFYSSLTYQAHPNSMDMAREKRLYKEHSVIEKVS